jgi:hypothetical protein
MLLLAAGTAGAVEQFNAFLRPDTSWVARGSNVAIRFEVDSTAHEFNGYSVIIRYDRHQVHFVTVAEGSLMTGACPNRFTYLTQTDSTVSYTHVILCDGVSLNGPGVLSTYTFHADSVGVCPLTIVSNPDRTFYDGGLYINPNNSTYPRQVILHNAVIRIVDPNSDAPGIGGGHDATFRLDPARPNPFSPGTRISFDLPRAAAVRLLIYDVAGRQVRMLTDQQWAAGNHTLEWDGRNDIGQPAGSGVYFYTMRAGGFRSERRMTLLR